MGLVSPLLGAQRQGSTPPAATAARPPLSAAGAEPAPPCDAADLPADTPCRSDRRQRAHIGRIRALRSAKPGLPLEPRSGPSSLITAPPPFPPPPLPLACPSAGAGCWLNPGANVMHAAPSTSAAVTKGPYVRIFIFDILLLLLTAYLRQPRAARTSRPSRLRPHPTTRRTPACRPAIAPKSRCRFVCRPSTRFRR